MKHKSGLDVEATLKDCEDFWLGNLKYIYIYIQGGPEVLTPTFRLIAASLKVL